LAKKGFPILGELSRKEDNFPGTILYYFEVTQRSEITTSNNWLVNNFLIKNFSFGQILNNNSRFSGYFLGLSDGNTSGVFGLTPNSYCMSANGIYYMYYYLSSGEENAFDLPNGDNGVPKRNGPEDVTG
jgi:hypothetical protein